MEYLWQILLLGLVVVFFMIFGSKNKSSAGNNITHKTPIVTIDPPNFTPVLKKKNDFYWDLYVVNRGSSSQNYVTTFDNSRVKGDGVVGGKRFTYYVTWN